MRVALNTALAQLLTSDALRDSRRFLASIKRRSLAGPVQLHYFHQADDPYSHVLVQLLPDLLSDYRLTLHVHLVAAPDAAAAPDRQRLQDWSRRDAAQLASHLGLHFRDTGAQPAAELLSLAQRALALAIADEEFIIRAAYIGNALWQGDEATLQALAGDMSEAATQAQLAHGGRQLARRGHYLGAMLWLESEWFWGADRLAQLQQRLDELGLCLPAANPAALQREIACRHQPSNNVRPQLQFFCSLRSPYSYLAIDRVRRLAEHYHCELILRPVLPMAMRGLPVPLAKRLYIVRDCKREAERLGLPFGKIADPLGAPTERGLAVLFRAIAEQRDAVGFLESFMRGVFAEGIDAGSEAGLLQLAARAGLERDFVTAALADQSWRETAEEHRSQLLAAGLWGVPSFRVAQNPMQWGQDRLWLIEQELIALTAAH